MRIMTALFLFCLFASSFLHPSSSQAALIAGEDWVKRANDLKLHERFEWHRLVHYQSSLWGGYESQADGEAFFVSPEGKWNPKAELEATIRGFFSAEKRKPTDMEGIPQSVLCQFPARFQWISEQTGLSRSALPQQDCKELYDLKSRLEAVSATLIFSSYYVNNPSSTFGHTLLRLNRSKTSSLRGGELIDSGVNYAANSNTQNPILFALYGLAGGFPGVFTVLPYYYKVREYNDFESRDLWEYDLNLTPTEIDQVVNHLWELGSTYFQYFYLTENCSYHMLTLLDAAVPRLNLAARVPFWVIPIDTIKAAIDEPGLVGDVKLRPSLYSQLSARISQLNSFEYEAFERLNSKESFQSDDLDGIAPESGARILDTIIDAIDFQHGTDLTKYEINKNILPADEPETKSRSEIASIASWKQNLLIARSRLPAATPLKEIQASSSRPDQGHSSARFAFGIGRDNNESQVIEGQLRFALHDFLDPREGYPATSAVEFLRITGRYLDKSKSFTVHDFRLFSVAMLNPLTRFNRRLSFKVDVGADWIYDRRCEGCLASTSSLLVGATIDPARSLSLFLLGGANFNWSPDFAFNELVPAATVLLGLRVFPTPSWSLLAEGSLSQLFDREQFTQQNLNIGSRVFFDRQQGLEGKATFQLDRTDTTFSYFRFF